jgi:hypothetical protein
LGGSPSENSAKRRPAAGLSQHHGMHCATNLAGTRGANAGDAHRDDSTAPSIMLCEKQRCSSQAARSSGPVIDLAKFRIDKRQR